MSTSSTPPEHSKPLSSSRSLQWAMMKSSGDERVQRVVDRMTPVIDLEPPPSDARDVNGTARQLAQATFPAGYSPDYPKENQWLNFKMKQLTHRYPQKFKGKVPKETRMEWKSARSVEWRRKHWGTKSKGNKTREKAGTPGAPPEIVGVQAVQRFYSVLQSTMSFFCHQNAPDPEFQEGFPWPKESVALAKEVVRLEFAGRPDQYDLYASRAETTTPFAKLSWFYSDWVSGPDSKAVQTKKQAASPIWVMNYQWGVIGHPLTGNMTEDRQEQKRPRITSVGKNMVHEPPREIDQSAMSYDDPIGLPKVQIDFTEWHKAHPTPTRQDNIDRDRQVSWMIYAHYMCAPFQRCSIDEFRNQFRRIIEQSRNWEDNKGYRTHTNAPPWFHLRPSRSTGESQIVLPANFTANSLTDGNIVYTGIYLPEEALHAHTYKVVFQECWDIWQTTRDGLQVMDALVQMLDYVQGYDIGAEHWLNMFHCSHFNKDGTHMCISGCGRALNCYDLEDQLGLSMCANCLAGSSSDLSSWHTDAVIARIAGKEFPTQFYFDLTQAIGLREDRVNRLKDSLDLHGSINFGVCDRNAFLRTLGGQVSRGRPIDQACTGIQRSIQKSDNPMMKLILYKSLRIHLAGNPPKTYLWHQDDVGMTRSGFGRLKYTHSGYTLNLLIKAIGVRQSHASNMPTPCLQELELIEARSHRAWSLERKLPHVLKPLVSADPASYVKTLSEMADLGHGSAEAGTQATEATDLYLPLAERNVDQVIFGDGGGFYEQRGSKDLDRVLRIIREWEKKSSHNFVLVRSTSGWPNPFGHESAKNQTWDAATVQSWFYRALTTLRTKCNKTFRTETELNPTTLYLLTCYWVIFYQGRCHFSGLRFSPFPRHPCRLSLGKRIHGSAMTCGWSTGNPSSAIDFDPALCNIRPEIWPVNDFKSDYKHEDIESFVFDVMVPQARSQYSVLMGHNTRLPLESYRPPQAAPIVANPPGQATDVRSSASSDLSDLSEEEVAPLTFKKHGESSTVGGAQLDHEPDSDDDDAMAEMGDGLVDVVMGIAVPTGPISDKETLDLERMWYTSAAGSDEELSAILGLVGSVV